jgi:DNA-binding NtrC family response regulator
LVTSLLETTLKAQGYEPRCVGTVANAKTALGSEEFAAVLLDMFLPDGDGKTVLAHALELDPPPAVLVMTARADIRGAVDAMKLGAADYIEKPFDVDDIAARLSRALETATLKRKLALYDAKNRAATSAVVSSPALTEVFGIATRLAATPASSALILGESGVGKEVLAAHIHESSERRGAPFVRVNLAAISESMIEAELFGSVRGAFTDSKRDRAGHFASAEGGTILLDEICEFKPELQPKLLRALEERRFFPVGSDRERKMNVRVLAATNRDPKAAIASGHLRADLYYRLATVVLKIPPLRERRDDIVPLAEHFLARFRQEFRRPSLRATDDANDALLRHGWPGNVRELRNVIERAAMLTPGNDVSAAELDLPTSLTVPPPAAADDPMSLEDVERTHIARILASVAGSRTRAAELLGISRSTLWEKAKRYGLL